MLKAYVRRYDNSTQPVQVRQAGQHLGVQDGKVRFARLFWDRKEPQDDEEARGYEALLESVPLLDTLVVTRMTVRGEERAVFHGLVTEVSSDDESISVIAVDNQDTQRLYDQPWWDDAPLFLTDQAAPDHLGSFPVAGAQPDPQAAQTLVPAAGFQPVSLDAHLRAKQNTTPPEDPAARPGGHPAAHPAGPWQPLTQPTPQQA